MKERLINPNLFWPKVNRGHGCWLWEAYAGNHGYGEISVYRKRRRVARLLAHRVSWFIFNGKIPPRIHVLHRCDVPRCVRPAHLFLGTMSQNMIDKRDKGRGNTKLNKESVAAIRGLRDGGVSAEALAAMFSISRRQVWQVTSRRCWKDVV